MAFTNSIQVSAELQSTPDSAEEGILPEVAWLVLSGIHFLTDHHRPNSHSLCSLLDVDQKPPSLPCHRTAHHMLFPLTSVREERRGRRRRKMMKPGREKEDKEEETMAAKKRTEKRKSKGEDWAWPALTEDDYRDLGSHKTNLYVVVLKTASRLLLSFLFWAGSYSIALTVLEFTTM